MQGLFSGATNYNPQSLSEINKDFKKMTQSAKVIIRMKKTERHGDLAIDLNGVFGVTFLLAERLIELDIKHGKEVLQEKPSDVFIEGLIDIAQNGHRHGNILGKIWNKQSFKIKNTRELSLTYRNLKDFCYDISDLENIGIELRKRFHRDGKLLFELKNYKYKAFHLLKEITIKSLPVIIAAVALALLGLS